MDLNINWDIAKAMTAVARTFAKKNPTSGVDKNHLLSMGKPMWEMSYKFAKADTVAHHLLVDNLHKKALEGDDMATFLLAAINVPVEQVALTGSALWCDQGYPQVTMGHKYAASLLSTRISPEVAKEVKAPWRAFHIEVPSGLLKIWHDVLNEYVDIKGVLAFQLEGSKGLRWCYFAYTGTTLTMHRHGFSTEELLNKDMVGSSSYDSSAFTEEMTDVDERTSFLIGRLIVNTCLMMTDRTNVTEPKESKKKGKSRRRESDEPHVRNYVLGKDKKLVHDCREAVRSFLETGREGSQINVQVLVAGHWKNQPHGPRMSLRKMMWVEPYWRGPEEAPIAVNVRTIRS